MARKATPATGNRIAQRDVLVEAVELPTYDGGCLGQIPLFPLQRDTGYLANKSFDRTWKTTIQGTEREFFCRGQFGSIAPNGYTQDVIVMACAFAVEHGGPSFVPASFYRFAKAKGIRPCQSHRDSIIRAFRSTAMTIKTNAVFDPKRGDWETVEIQSIVTSFAYEDEQGECRERCLIKKGEDGHLVRVKSEERVRKLKRFSIDPEYFRHFVGNGNVRYDLNAYFHVGSPTAKRAYLNLCSAVQLFGGQSMSLETYLKLLGKDPEHVARRAPSELRKGLEADIERVNRLGVGQIAIEGDGRATRVVVSPANKVLRLAADLDSFSQAESRVYRALRDAGLYANIAKTCIVRFSRALGKDLLSYVKFAIEQETMRAKERIRMGKARVPDLRKHVAANLTKAFCLDPESVKDGKSLGDHWHYAAWRDWMSSRKRSSSSNSTKVAHVARVIGRKAANASSGEGAEERSIETVRFDLSDFRSRHEEIYARIVSAVSALHPVSFPEGVSAQEKIEHMAAIEKDRSEAIDRYAQECFTAFLKGDMEFFPVGLSKAS